MAAALAAVCSAQNADKAPLRGYTEAHSIEERALEKKFQQIPTTDGARAFHRELTREPHPAGTARNNYLARWLAAQWRAQGLEDVVIHRYDVLGSVPLETSLEMVAPVHYKASLREAPYDADPDTKNPRVHSAYASMSESGDVTAPLVYAHSGNPEDYELLKKNGIDVRGKVVLVRYSNPYSYRGFKAYTAQQLGVAALLIYSDPQEDGFKKGKVFPDGPWGPETHIQRGAITYDFIVPGDPLTPGWASVPGAKRIARKDARSLPHVVAMPLSWHDAKPLLEQLDGPEAPPDWQGGLGFKYRLGGGRVQVHVKVRMQSAIQPYYVVEGRIRGSDMPDEWVVLGNHRDAWEFGGVDPSSGTAAMLEMTRAFGQLKKEGMRPRRTLVFCSWDGEEVGLTGSTEWGEQFAGELQQKAIAYLNVDEATSGADLDVDAVASLAPLMLDLSRDFTDPATGKPLHDAWTAAVQRTRTEDKDNTPTNDATLVNTRIGSGSDHTVFLNHLGLPVIGLGFVGPYGVYHSMYDDFYWMNHFGDPGYRYHQLMAQLWGTTALRLADADVYPMDFAVYGDNLRQFIDELKKKNPEADDQLKLDRLLSEIGEFTKAGLHVNSAMKEALASAKPALRDPEVNRGFRQVEANWLIREGIPGRPWFKHTLYAARYTYAHLELPGVTEAVEKKDWETAREQLKLLEAAVAHNTELLHHLATVLENEATQNAQLAPPQQSPRPAR
jgi:N-acetylated-alpha-linked acidic dipeptidase